MVLIFSRIGGKIHVQPFKAVCKILPRNNINYNNNFFTL